MSFQCIFCFLIFSLLYYRPSKFHAESAAICSGEGKGCHEVRINCLQPTVFLSGFHAKALVSPLNSRQLVPVGHRSNTVSLLLRV